MELYIGGTAQGKKVYVTQVRGIAEARIWDNFEEWFREKLQESASKSPSPEAESMAYLEKQKVWNGLYVESDRESNRTVSDPAWNDAGKCRTPVYWQTDG